MYGSPLVEVGATRERVRVSWRGDVVVATIDVPDPCHAADLEAYRLLEAALSLESRACVVIGAGGRFAVGDQARMFCAFDDELVATRFVHEVTRLFELVESVPKPVVAAVDGDAFGFGFELALACDAVVATPAARFGLPEITHGTAPLFAITRGADVIGRGLARHLALGGTRWLTGAECEAHGLVSQLCPPEEIEAAAVSLGGALAEDASFAHLKRLSALEAPGQYRLAALVMPPLMCAASVRDEVPPSRRPTVPRRPLDQES